MNSPSEDRLDLVFRVLADRTRRDIWETLGRSPGQTTSELVGISRSLSRWAVMKHIAVLREAGLVQMLPQGRRRRHYRDERALAALRDWLREQA